MRPSRCAVVAFKRVCCIPVHTSSSDRVAGMVAEWFSMHVLRNISLQLDEELKSEMWESLEADGGASLNSKGEQCRLRNTKKNAVAFSAGLEDRHSVCRMYHRYSARSEKGSSVSSSSSDKKQCGSRHVVRHRATWIRRHNCPLPTRLGGAKVALSCYIALDMLCKELCEVGRRRGWFGFCARLE